MRSSSIGQISAAVALTCLWTAAVPAGAKWMRPTDIPVSRLLKSTAAYVKAHPKDAQGYYMLGRINSAAFAMGTETLGVYTNEPLPAFPGYARSPVEVRTIVRPISTRDLAYYGNALRNYRKATELDPKSAIAWLGAGFECEEGLRYPQTVAKACQILGLSGKTATERLRAEALRCYRRSYELSAAADSSSKETVLVKAISQEAAEGIVHLQAGRSLTAVETAEMDRMREAIRTLEARPHAITPILVAFRGEDRLPDLLNPRARIHFDLTGDGVARDWPWVRPEAGVLVWDPHRAGGITSGRQLFGSVTWWLFWRDGYAPLAALDDNGVGRLDGVELKGIAVWFDRNGNGASDAGEVTPVQALGIREIHVRSAGRRDGVLWNPSGIVFRDGRKAATFDWKPTSLQPMRRAAPFGQANNYRRGAAGTLSRAIPGPDAQSPEH